VTITGAKGPERRATKAMALKISKPAVKNRIFWGFKLIFTNQPIHNAALEDRACQVRSHDPSQTNKDQLVLIKLDVHQVFLRKQTYHAQTL
jgi:hypothetical protein